MSDRVRILHVVPSYLPAVRYGGPIFAVHSLCRALASKGHDVEILTTNINGPEQSNVPIGVRVDLDGVQVRYFSSPFLTRLAWAPSLRLALQQEITNFDLVHLHSVFLWPTWAAASEARKAHVPYIISPRGMLVKDLIKRRSSIAKTVWITLFEKLNLERASAIHVTSELERTEVMRFKWRLPQIAKIPNGVEDHETLTKSEPSQEIADIVSQEPLVLFLGRISWKKGLDRLLNAFAFTVFGRLAIVGSDDEGLVPRLRQHAYKLGIAHRILFLPRTVLGRDKEHLFAAARLFVLPSYSENFGNTVVEAMQRGVPVVVTPEVGAAEIVRKAGGGLVVQGDPKSLGEAISRVVNDPIFAQGLGKAGRRYIMEHCTWQQIANQMEALYKGIKS